MDFDVELPEFSNRCRLFPLPDVVLFPHSLVPLHIFEPRYRQLTEDALASDRLVTMVQVRPTLQGSPWVEPVPIMDVGCLGRIVQHERLPDGRFNFLLFGCKRVRLLREIPSTKLYRIAEAEVMDDEVPSRSSERFRSELVELFRRVFTRRKPLDEDLYSLVASEIPLGALCDIITHSLGLTPATKQSLLSESKVRRRLLSLRSIMRELVGEEESARPFPPPFSVN